MTWTNRNYNQHFQAMNVNSKEKITNGTLIRAMIMSGLIVGTLDITMAILQTLAMGRNPLNMLKFIASGVFGKASFEDGWMYAFLGLLFHYGIALGWTSLFYWTYPKIKLLSKHRILTGVGYGFFVWLMMNQIVLPLSRTPSLTFNWTSAITGIIILILAIGLPLSFMAHRVYNGKRSKHKYYM